MLQTRQIIVISQSLLEILPKMAGSSLSNCFSKSYLTKKNLNYANRNFQVHSLQINLLQSNKNLYSIESLVMFNMSEKIDNDDKKIHQ